MTNEQMTPNRFGKWARSRKLVARIQQTLSAGGIVVIGTCTKATKYDRRHVTMFKATRSGAYVQRGKGWDCIDYCNFQFVQ